MNALSNILIYYNNSRQDDLYREVTGNILKNLKRIENASIYDLAEMCFVSTTTISRLCKRLGYKNFMDFKLELSGAVKKYAYMNRHIPINSLEKGEDEFEAYFRILDKQIQMFKSDLDKSYLGKIADAIQACRKVSIYTHGTSAAELSLQTDLVIGGKETVMLLDTGDQISDAASLDEDCFVFVSVPSLIDSSPIEEIIRVAKGKKAKVFVLTTSRYASFLKNADYSYCFDGMLHIIDMHCISIYIHFLTMTYRKKYID